MSFHVKWTKRSKFSFVTLVGISVSWEGSVLSRFLKSSSIFSYVTWLKKKLPCIFWLQYWRYLLNFQYQIFFFIFRFLTAFANILKRLIASLSSSIFSSSLTRVILPDWTYLSENKGFTIFQNVLLSVILFTSRLN